ncbi:MAG: protein kinase domain-containing protein, partial [Phycisphaerae bacterium]
MKPCPFCAEPIQDAAIKCKHCGSMLSDTAADALTDFAPTDTLDGGQTILAEQLIEGRVLAGRYQVVRLLGSGGMGEVWLAEDRELDDMPVAIKVLPPLLARNPRSVAALKREAALSLKLTHPNICRLHGFQSDGELKFLVMEYIDGRTLEELLDQQDTRTLRLEQLLPIAQQIAEALDYAHSLSPPVLHRDIKPGNIMVTSGGTAKLLDFGIARELKDSMTRVTGQQTTGTLLYMAPEQFAGKDPTPASDVYALAATLYECLRSRPPFHQGAIGHQLLHMEPEPIGSQPEHVNKALLAGLAKDPAERPASGKALVADASSPPPPPRESRPQPPKTRPAAASPSRRAESSSVRATPKASSHSAGVGISESGGASLSAGSSFGAGKWLAVALVLAGLLGLYAFLNDSGSADSDSPDSVVSSVYEEEDAADSSHAQRAREEAQEAYRKALGRVDQSLLAEHGQGTWQRVRSHAATGKNSPDPQEAVRAYRQAASLLPEAVREANGAREQSRRDQQDRLFSDHLSAARRALDRKDLSSAESALSKALAIKPGDSSARALARRLEQLRASSRSLTVYTDWPFTSTEAKRRQSATAKALGLKSTTKTLRLPGGETLELVLIPAG